MSEDVVVVDDEDDTSVTMERLESTNHSRFPGPGLQAVASGKNVYTLA